MRDIRRMFNEELAEIEQSIVHAAALVVEGTQHVTQVLLDTDVDQAEAIIAADDDIDLITAEVEERIYRTIALQHPVARDLRLLMAADKMTAEIERSGDLVSNIAKAAIRLVGAQLPPNLRGLLDRMREQVALLFNTAIRSLIERDADLAESLHRLDDVLDDLHRDFIDAIFTAHDRGEIDIQQAVQLSMVGRFYERLGDHAVNVGERAHYVITGWIPTGPADGGPEELAV